MKWTLPLAKPVYAQDTTIASWWQSRQKMRNPPKLTDLTELARAIRGIQ